MSTHQTQNGAVQVSLRFRMLGLLVALLAGVTFIPQTPAAADNFTIINAANPVHAYRQPTPSSGIVFAFWPGEAVTIECQDYGVMTANGTNIWDLVANPATGNGLAGWISDFYASTPVAGDFSPGIPRCGVPIPPPPTGGPGMAVTMVAFSRAASQVGQTYQPDGATGWACWCDHFVAYLYGRQASGYPSAMSHYYDLLHRGLIHFDRHPPFGTLAFYNTSGDGHVVFSLGTGLVITTPYNSGCQPTGVVYQTNLNHFGHFLGWSWPNPEWFS